MSLIDPLDINGNPCDGYDSIWPCYQWIPKPYTSAEIGTSALPQLTVDVGSTQLTQEVVEIPHITPPVTVTPEPAYTVLFGAFLAVLLGRSVWRSARKYTTKEPV